MIVSPSFVLAILLALFSFFVGIKTSAKIIGKSSDGKMRQGYLGKVFLSIFSSILIFISGILLFMLSYSFFLKKAFRASTENIHTATVIDYEEEIIRTKNFSTSYMPSDKLVFFPRVIFTDSNGRRIVKVVDIASDAPMDMGAMLKITDNESQKRANLLELRLTYSLIGILVTTSLAFLFALICSYPFYTSLKPRKKMALAFTGLIFFINFSCSLLIYIVTI